MIDTIDMHFVCTHKRDVMFYLCFLYAIDMHFKWLYMRDVMFHLWLLYACAHVYDHAYKWFIGAHQLAIYNSASSVSRRHLGSCSQIHKIPHEKNLARAATNI